MRKHERSRAEHTRWTKCCAKRNKPHQQAKKTKPHEVVNFPSPAVTCQQRSPEPTQLIEISQIFLGMAPSKMCVFLCSRFEKYCTSTHDVARKETCHMATPTTSARQRSVPRCSTNVALVNLPRVSVTTHGATSLFDKRLLCDHRRNQRTHSETGLWEAFFFFSRAGGGTSSNHPSASPHLVLCGASGVTATTQHNHRAHPDSPTSGCLNLSADPSGPQLTRGFLALQIF